MLTQFSWYVVNIPRVVPARVAGSARVADLCLLTLTYDVYSSLKINEVIGVRGTCGGNAHNGACIESHVVCLCPGIVYTPSYSKSASIRTLRNLWARSGYGVTCTTLVKCKCIGCKQCIRVNSLDASGLRAPVTTRTATKQRWLGLKLCDEAGDEEDAMDEPSAAKRPSVLTIDRAAFLLLRVKRAFKKKRQQRKEKQ
ncbi:unnamed protein product [Colias eurytheme]|nr:unnamed protein product [Colias eurytheme]